MLVSHVNNGVLLPALLVLPVVGDLVLCVLGAASAAGPVLPANLSVASPRG